MGNRSPAGTQPPASEPEGVTAGAAVSELSACALSADAAVSCQLFLRSLLAGSFAADLQPRRLETRVKSSRERMGNRSPADSQPPASEPEGVR